MCMRIMIVDYIHSRMYSRMMITRLSIGGFLLNYFLNNPRTDEYISEICIVDLLKH